MHIKRDFQCKKVAYSQKFSLVYRKFNKLCNSLQLYNELKVMFTNVFLG